MTLRLFNPDGHDGPGNVSSNWSVGRFVNHWYLNAIQNNRAKKPPGPATIDKRLKAARWWTELMGSADQPEGPMLAEIKAEHLLQFQEKLKTARYRRGKLGQWRIMQPFTQYDQVHELMIILNAAGPPNGRDVRAGVLQSVPAIYLEKPATFPKDTWMLDEAKQLIQGLHSYDRIYRYKGSVDQYRLLARATIAFWFYTGHRASTFRYLTSKDLVEFRPGHWYLYITKSVKTGKKSRVAVHPALLQKLQEVEASVGPDAACLIPWSMIYRTLLDHHEFWQEHAGLERIFSPQAWRRLHAETISRMGLDTARSLAAGSLGHSSPSVTEAHYTSVNDAAILHLPDLFAD